MPKRILLVLTTSAVLAVAVTWVSVRPDNQPASPPPAEAPVSVKVKRIAVLAAATSIAKGSDLTADMVESIEIPASELSSEFILDSKLNRARLFDLRADEDIAAGVPLMSSGLIVPAVQEELIPEVVPVIRPVQSLGAGMRAISVPLNREASLASMIEPGDRIDVMVSYQTAQGIRAVRNILENVRVLALNGMRNGGSDRHMMTLELHSEGTKVLALAQQTGELVFVLSSTQGEGLPVIIRDGPMLSTQISGAPVAVPTPPRQARRVTVIRGSSGQDEVKLTRGEAERSDQSNTFQTGGLISADR